MRRAPSHNIAIQTSAIVVLTFVLPSLLGAQWLNHPTPGLPRKSATAGAIPRRRPRDAMACRLSGILR